jgi:FdrA protein
MIFSNNVSLEDELRLKRLARDRELLVMGPDCGTAIVGGVPLAFANVVRRGSIGVVGASGSGIQQVTCLVDAMDCGISHALGTGARDLSHEVGGMTMVKGIRALDEDPETKVIVLISKPPATEVAKTVLAAASAAAKPVVVNFLGIDPAGMTAPGVTPVRTLEEAAGTAVTISKGDVDHSPLIAEPDLPVSALSRLAPGQRYVRGLFSGGTLCYEAAMLLSDSLEDLSSNTPLRPEMAIADPWRSTGHTLLDMGAEVFTSGRPHPMIDMRLRCERLEQETVDPETAVLLFDMILGFGSHPDPASELVPAITRAQEKATVKGLAPIFVGFVCGTAGDPQNFKQQCAALKEAGVLLAASNAQAARLVARIAAAITTAKPTDMLGSKM